MTIEIEKQKYKGKRVKNPKGGLTGGPAKPLKDKKGRPTRHALQARAWGEAAPTSQSAAKALGAKGRRMLDAYQRSKKLKKFVKFVNA